MAINAHPLEKVKRAVSEGGECGNVYFLHPCACPQRRLRQGLILVHQALRKSKCENAAEATGFCTMSLSDCWFCLFEGVGINSQNGGVILSTVWTQTCSITTNRGVYIVVVQVTAGTHTMIVRWSDPYGFLAPDNGLPSAPVCQGTDGNYRTTGDLGAFGLTSSSISNDGAQTCIRFP